MVSHCFYTKDPNPWLQHPFSPSPQFWCCPCCSLFALQEIIRVPDVIINPSCPGAVSMPSLCDSLQSCSDPHLVSNYPSSDSLSGFITSDKPWLTWALRLLSDRILQDPTASCDDVSVTTGLISVSPPGWQAPGRQEWGLVSASIPFLAPSTVPGR